MIKAGPGFDILVALGLLLIAIAGLYTFNDWRECKAAGGSYVQTLEFGNGYSCVDLKEK